MPLLSYYGAKNRLAKKYPAPSHDIIIEPFAGSAGYSLLHRDKQVILYEKNLKTFSALNYLIKAKPEEILSLPLLNPEQSVDELNIIQEAKWLIGFWLQGGDSRPKKKFSNWGKAKDKNKNANYWGNRCKERLSIYSSQIKHWKIYNQSFENAPNIRATWFIDPPYQNKGYPYPDSSKNIDFNFLGEWCKERKGQVMVCENEGAKWLPFVSFCEMKGKLKDGNNRKLSKEVLYYVDGH